MNGAAIIILKAIEFELNAIFTDSTDPNPHAPTLKRLGLWEEVERAVEEACHEAD